MTDVTDHIDRRRFLAAGAGLLSVGLVGAAGCASSSTAKGAGASTTTTGSGPGPFAVLSSVFDYFTGIDQRVAFALATNDSQPIHPTSPVMVQIGPNGGALDPPVVGVVHGTGLTNPYVLVTHRFTTPGMYVVRVSYNGQQSDLPIKVVTPADTQIPMTGKPMISVPTPTNASPMGVNPVCTDQPPCPFHSTSLDAALAAHRPVALMFATPALCQSRFCGPVLDNLVAVHQPFASKVTFIHCEIYTDLSGQTSTAPVLAYHLEHEPMLLLAGPDGVVRERIDNASDQTEQADALARLSVS